MSRSGPSTMSRSSLNIFAGSNPWIGIGFSVGHSAAEFDYMYRISGCTLGYEFSGGHLVAADIDYRISGGAPAAYIFFLG